jgi:hypothetical protein
MEPRARLTFDARLSLPNHALFIGGTQSGKTTLCLHLLTHPELFNPKPARIIFYYDQYQDSYLNAKSSLATQGIELLLYKGLANVNLDNLDHPSGQTILLIDDFSEETSSSNEIARIATNGRHKNISLWLVWHSLFSRHPASRVITQNVCWFFFLPSLRLESQLRTFGSQLGMKSRLLAAFKACQDDFTADFRYILVDAGPRTPDIMRIRSRVHDQDKQYCFD